MRILDQGSTIPVSIDYEGILKMEGESGLHGRQLSSSDSDQTVSLSRSLSSVVVQFTHWVKVYTGISCYMYIAVYVMISHDILKYLRIMIYRDKDTV